MVPQDDIQLDHWTNIQVTLLVHIVYFHVPNNRFANRKVYKVCHYYVNDDKKHNSIFVQHAYQILDVWLEA